MTGEITIHPASGSEFQTLVPLWSRITGSLAIFRGEGGKLREDNAGIFTGQWTGGKKLTPGIFIRGSPSGGHK